MSGNTTTEGYPYPLTSDFADVQDAFRLATAIDTGLRAEQAPVRAFMGRPSFIGRSTVTGGGFVAGTQTLTMGAVDWDNTGGLAAGNTSWSQPLSQDPSWWMFGATILVNIVSGTPVVGDMCMARLNMTTTDPVTTVATTSRAYQRNDETNTNGEWLNIVTMAPIYQGSVSCTLILNGSTQKSIQSGSRLWGLYLGPVT